MEIDEAVKEVRRSWRRYGDNLDRVNSVYRELLEASVVLADYYDSLQHSDGEKPVGCTCITLPHTLKFGCPIHGRGCGEGELWRQ